MRHFALRDCLAIATYDQAQLFGTRTVDAMITLGHPRTYSLLSAEVLGAADLVNVARELHAADARTLSAHLDILVPLVSLIVAWALLCQVASMPAIKYMRRLWAVANQRPLAFDSSSRHPFIIGAWYAVSAFAIAAIIAIAAYYAALGVVSPTTLLAPSVHTLYVLVPTVLATFGLGTLWLAVLSRLLRPGHGDIKSSGHCPVCLYEISAVGCAECGWGKTSQWPRGKLAVAFGCVALVWILAMIFPAMAWCGAVFAKQRAVANHLFASGQRVAVFVPGESRAVIFDLPDNSQILVDVQLLALDVTRESSMVWHRASTTADWQFWGDVGAISPGMPLIPAGFSSHTAIARAPVQTGLRLAMCIQPTPIRLHYASDELLSAA
jgi:hypothetical protein